MYLYMHIRLHMCIYVHIYVNTVKLNLHHSSHLLLFLFSATHPSLGHGANSLSREIQTFLPQATTTPRGTQRHS